MYFIAVVYKWAATWQNQQNGMCAQRRHRSAWASAQSDQSSLSAWRKLGSLATHLAHSQDSDRLIWVFAGCTVILLVMSCCDSNLLRFSARVNLLRTSEDRFTHDRPKLDMVWRIWGLCLSNWCKTWATWRGKAAPVAEWLRPLI